MRALRMQTWQEANAGPETPWKRETVCVTANTSIEQ